MGVRRRKRVCYGLANKCHICHECLILNYNIPKYNINMLVEIPTMASSIYIFLVHEHVCIRISASMVLVVGVSFCQMEEYLPFFSQSVSFGSGIQFQITLKITMCNIYPGLHDVENNSS